MPEPEARLVEGSILTQAAVSRDVACYVSTPASEACGKRGREARKLDASAIRCEEVAAEMGVNPATLEKMGFSFQT